MDWNRLEEWLEESEMIQKLECSKERNWPIEMMEPGQRKETEETREIGQTEGPEDASGPATPIDAAVNDNAMDDLTSHHSSFTVLCSAVSKLNLTPWQDDDDDNDNDDNDNDDDNDDDDNDDDDNDDDDNDDDDGRDYDAMTKAASVT